MNERGKRHCAVILMAAMAVTIGCSDAAPPSADLQPPDMLPDVVADALIAPDAADVDGDGYHPPADCDDLDALVYPGQAAWFDKPSQRRGWDYNCDGVEQPQLTAMSHCWGGGTAAQCLQRQLGWLRAPAPGCGETAEWVVSCGVGSGSGGPWCTVDSKKSRIQACR